MRVLTYTSPWPGNLIVNELSIILFSYQPHFCIRSQAVNRRCCLINKFMLNALSADHLKSEEYYSDPRLAAYAVPYNPVISRYSIKLSDFLF